MATSVHSTLTGSDLHESKGVATALAGEVYVTDGAGSGVWTPASSVITNTAFSTGDLKDTHKTTADAGWILWVDGTIGDGSSSASLRANADTAALFALYWNGYTNTLCPVSGGRGSTAVADYAAHKTIAVPVGSGRLKIIAGSGSGLTSRVLGTTYGGETQTLITANLPAYTPAGTIANVLTGNTGLTISGGTQQAQNGSATAAFIVYNGVVSVGVTSTFTGTAQGGTSTAFGIIPPAAAVNVMIKL